MPLEYAFHAALFFAGGLAGIVACQLVNLRIERQARNAARQRSAAIEITPIRSDLHDSDASLPTPAEDAF